MFQRFASHELAAWKRRERRMPLVVRGARQTGKSELVRIFAREQFHSLVEVNFEQDPAAALLFESNDPAKIQTLLEIHARARIVPGGTLLFLDEVQAAPRVLTALRYFHEKAPRLHVIAAGSLLDIALDAAQFSMPVGRIEYLHLGPVRFEEFLVAAGESQAREFIAGWHLGEPFPEALHFRLLDLLRLYMVLGGMPAAVAAYLETRGLHDSDRIKHSIVSTYRDDFAKYGRRVSVDRVRKVFDALPGLVGLRFKYSHVDREERSKDLAAALRLLCMARVAHRVPHSAGSGVPLAASADESRFKILLLDIGLMLAAQGLSLLDLTRAGDLTVVNAGAAAEQLIGQHLLFSEEAYKEPSLFFWARDARNSSAEVDYLMALGPQVVAVEVKAGKTGTLKSLHAFVEEKASRIAVRFNSEPPSVLRAETSLPSRPRRPFVLLSLPLYIVEQARRLCREALDRS